jgi:hypothetical protein
VRLTTIVPQLLEGALALAAVVEDEVAFVGAFALAAILLLP